MGPDSPPCRYPRLTYDISLVPGVENSLPAPVIFPKLDSRNDVLYDGTKDVELRVVGMDGLKLTVKAGSVTFPESMVLSGQVPVDNRNPGPRPEKRPLERPVRLGLNQVHHDTSRFERVATPRP